MKPKRLAAIDIGTNSIRCIVAAVDKGGKYRVLDDEKTTVRLGEVLVGSGGVYCSALLSPSPARGGGMIVD